MTRLFLFFILFFTTVNSFAQSDQMVLKDLAWDKSAPARMTELNNIRSNGSRLAGGMIYTANGKQKHPTLILLHGFPGNEKNLDIAQVVRSHGWNVIYFNYRGSWGGEGKFSFLNCVEDVKNVVAYCNKYQDSLKIDTANIVLFGHSMGGWVCLKALEQLPQIKKAFALSTWDLSKDLQDFKTEKDFIDATKDPSIFPDYFVLNATNLEMFSPVFSNNSTYKLATNITAFRNKEIIMLDENILNKGLADTIKANGTKFFDYRVWDTDHSFTNKRVSLMNLLISFLDK